MKNKHLFKAIMTFVFAAVFVLSCGLTSFAVRAVLNSDNSKKEIGVYAKYVDNTEFNTVSTDKDGNGTLTLPDGTLIEVGGVDDNEGRLVVELITEKEALDWIYGITDGKVKNYQAYHIYYIDAAGNIKPAVDVAVTIKTDDLPQDAVVYSVGADGKATELVSFVKSGEITFTVNGEPYYVIGERITSPIPDLPDKSDEPDSPDVPDIPDVPDTPDMPDKPGKPNDSDSPDSSIGSVPKTGYDNHTALLLILFFISTASLITTSVYNKKKKHVEK